MQLIKTLKEHYMLMPMKALLIKCTLIRNSLVKFLKDTQVQTLQKEIQIQIRIPKQKTEEKEKKTK
jgi:hypothetical protein